MLLFEGPSFRLHAVLFVTCALWVIRPVAPQSNNYRNAITCQECLIVDGGGKDYINTTIGIETNLWGTPCNGSVTITGEASGGTISDGCSPRYDNNMYCHWLIAPTGAQFLSVQIHALSLEMGWDFLNITDGNGTLLGVFTGTPSNIVPLFSSSGMLDFRFYSDRLPHGYGWNNTRTQVTGFNVSWAVVTTACLNGCTSHGVCEDNVCKCDYDWFGSDCSQEYCGGTKLETDAVGYLTDWSRTSNDWNTKTGDTDIYRNHMDCRWLIRPPQTQSPLRLKVWRINLERVRDELKIYDGNSVESSLLASLDYNLDRSLQKDAPVIVASGSEVYIHYRTDYVGRRGGFYMSWSALEQCQDTCHHGVCDGESCKCDTGWWGADCSVKYCLGAEVRTSSEGVLVSHSETGRYNDQSDCSWLIHPSEPANFMMIYITFFALEAGLDFLTIYDGNNISAHTVLRDYNNYITFDTVLTGDGIHRTTEYTSSSLDGVEPFVYSKHQVLLTTNPFFYMHFETDSVTHDVTSGKALGGARYPGVMDDTQYGDEGTLGFELSYKGVFCGGITRFIGSSGFVVDGSAQHNYSGGQYCLFWIRPGPPVNATAANTTANATGNTSNTTADTTNTNNRTGSPDMMIELTVNSVSMDRTDMLRVLDGNCTSANVMQAYHNTTGSGLKVTTTSSITDGILLEFATDPDFHAEGFNISWNLVELWPGDLCSEITQLTAPYGTFRDHSGDFHSYRNAMDCSWEISAVEFVQQIEFFVEELSLHPGKSWDFFNSTGLAQQKIIRLGQSHHPFADFVSLYKGHRSLQRTWSSEQMMGNYTGYMKPTTDIKHSQPVVKPMSFVFNGTTAGAWFHSTAAYVGEGFMVRYQTVYSDADTVEMWGDGLTHAVVGKAAIITLRTKRKLYTGMKDVRTGRIIDSASVSDEIFMTQGGAALRIRLWLDDVLYIEGESYDLDTGYYFLSYQTTKVGRFKVTVEMLTYPLEASYGTPAYRPVVGSPFYVNVNVGEVHVDGSTVTGAGLLGAPPGERTEFMIQAGDVQGNLIHHGGHRFVAKLDGPEAVAAVVKDNEDGTYLASYRLAKAGDYILFVGLAYGSSSEVAIKGSPFSFAIEPIPCPADCSGNGECGDTGICTCVAQFEGEDCATDFLEFYTTFLLYENIALGSLLVLYLCYVAYTSVKEARVGMKRGGAGAAGFDDDSDEEEEFLGLACCMHW